MNKGITSTLIWSAVVFCALLPAASAAENLANGGQETVLPRDRVFNVKDYGAILDGKTDDAPAIMAAFQAMKVNGHPFGTLLIPGVARIASTLDLDGGYRNTTSEGQWSRGQGEDFKVMVAGSLRADPGIGVAVNLHGARNVWTDIRFDRGGNDSDIALHVGDLDLADIGVRATDFAGTVLHADASKDRAQRIRSSKVREVYASSCGRAIYWRGIEAFGTFEFVWDRNCTRGSHFLECADIGIQHYENFSPATQQIGLHFEQCNMFSVGTLSLGDRPQQALVQITGGDFGSIQRIRVSGRPYSPTRPQTEGLRLVNVKSLNIDNLQTFRCRIGLHAIGSSFTVKLHHSMTGDINPLVVEGTEQYAAPKIDIGALYRYNHRESVRILDNVKGGILKLHGQIYLMNIDQTNNEIYAIDCRSKEIVLDVADLTQDFRGGLLGAVYHPDPSKIVGVAEARFANPLEHGKIEKVTLEPGVMLRNETQRTLNLYVTVKYVPTDGLPGKCTVLLGPKADKLAVIASGEQPADGKERKQTFYLRVPAWWQYQVDAENATVENVAEFGE